MKEIPLSKGRVALVDDEDYVALTAHKWCYLAGYAVRTVWPTRAKSKTVLMHRVLLSPAPGKQVDHINGDGLDNRRVNLREATPSQNQANSRKRQRHGGRKPHSQYKGVTREYSKWVARITYGGRVVRLGLFEEELDAASAYRSAAKQLCGPYARFA